jgi:hypothetical protein
MCQVITTIVLTQRMSVRRHFGVRRLAAAFAVDTVAPYGLFERNGWHRKSGSKLPHSKAPQDGHLKVSATKTRESPSSREAKKNRCGFIGWSYERIRPVAEP